jgi:hypothetical protein
VLVEGDAHRALGPALAWSMRNGANSLDLVVDADGGLLARRAAHFDTPIRVWLSADRSLFPALPEPLDASSPPTSEHLDFRRLIDLGGAEFAVEHGVVSGEVRGLEVCRVVEQPTVGSPVEAGDAATIDAVTFDAGTIDGPTSRPDGVQLEVGVGAADREAFQLVHGDIPTVDALARVARSVAAHRSEDAPQHPLNRLARERFLRWRAIADPSLVGLAILHAAEPPVPRRNLKDAVPCVAAGTDADGRPVTVVFSSGVDLDLVPYVADVAETTDDDLLIALPRRDLVPITRQMAALLSSPVGFHAVD